MSRPARIATVDQLDASWLGAALIAGGQVGQVEISDIAVEQIGEGVGIASLLYRVTPTYAGDEGPATIVLKLPTQSPETRFVVDAFDFYSKECRFYDELAVTTPVKSAEAYYIDVDHDSGDFVLLMEDVVGARIVDQTKGCTAAEAFAAMETLARIHAYWWEPGPIDEVAWLPRPQDPPYPQALQQQIQLSWPRVAAKHGDLVPDEVAAIGGTFHTHVADLMARLSVGPTTFVHGDYRLDNLLFPASGIEPITVIDWQICLRGKGSYDTGYFMSQSLDPAQRSEIERDLLRHYWDHLVEGGVSGYDFDQCWEDYRLGLLYCFVYPASGEAIELVNDRAIELFRSLLERSCRAIVETGALELLP
ncbi:MAG: phosphotransferase [Actinomycetia bacterium]|nr:phosphotransferase [Actinomycetes bacterium]